MRIACLISGLPRSFKYNIEKMKKILGENTDYFLHITEDYNDKYNNSNTDYVSIISILKPVQIIQEKDPKYECSNNINMRKQWYKFNIVNNMKNHYEKIKGIKYDLVVRIRPDLCILDNIIKFEDIKENTIYGNNDEFFYGNSNTFDIISELIFHFDEIKKESIKKPDFFYNYLKLKDIELKTIDLNYKLILTECNIIAISGDSGCGKTTLINNLDKLFNGKSLKIEGDRYHKWERGDPNWNNFTHLNPEANYICKFKEDTFNLKIGENIYQVDYEHSTGKFTGKQKIQNSKNILMCGLHTLYDTETNNLFNLKIFLDTDTNLKYYWKIKRDILKRGYTIEQVLDKIKQRENDNIKYIEPQKNNSNIIIRFFTNKDFNYKDLNKEPNIYLKISSNKNILDFIKILDKYNIEYSISKNKYLYSLIFYKIEYDFKSVLLYYIKEETIMSENNYYTIIIAFVLFFNSK
jgi:uridine kinase